MIQLVQQYENGFHHPKGHPGGVLVPNHDFLFTQWPKVLEMLGKPPEGGAWKNLYYTNAHHLLPVDRDGRPIGTEAPQRNAGTFLYQSVLSWDIDGNCDLARAFEYLGCVARVLGVPPDQLILNSTGNGLHVIAHIKTPIRSTKLLKELKPAYNEVCEMIEKQMRTAALPFGKVDPVIFDAARVLRCPGTINSKPSKTDPTKFDDKECIQLQNSSVVHDLDLMVISGLDRFEKENISVDQIRRQFPTPDFEEIVKECQFVKWTMEHPDEVHEPQIFDLISLMAVQTPAARVTYKNQEMSARELTEAVFEGAVSSRSCARQKFDEKWESASRYGARKCSTISSNWIGGCQKCPHHSRIPTPLALRSPDHVGSEALGYWVVNSKGAHTYPHYGDLAKVYKREHSYVTTPKKRIFTFNQTHYFETTELDVFSWIEKKVNPTDPLRAMHRTEFAKKIEVVGAMSAQTEAELFDRSIIGKMNFKNGILDIRTGELSLHTPQVGFQYVLPYEYEAGQTCPEFLEWLSEMMLGRTELVDAVLDVMAYCLWPAYDDHMFTYFVGEGANGKSTVIRILKAMIGEGNCSSISMQQLGSNRFAPANLEGKLVNLSEESSGYDMNHDELNVIKNLSAGGFMQVERKGAQGYEFQNKAKLIFSANHPPKFRETGLAIQRRMLAIPFDYKILVRDDSIAVALIEKAPQITSMLITRIQENIAKNNGRFLVSRGGTVALAAKEKILYSGNTVIEWAAEHVESSSTLQEDQCIEVQESFSHYMEWCQKSNYKPVTKNQFSQLMYDKMVCPLVQRDKNVIRVGNKSVRVFKRTKWKEGSI